MKDVEFHTERRAQGGNEGKEGVLKPPQNMKQLRRATRHGAASWQIFVLNLPFFDLFAQRAFRICHLQWPLVQDVLSKALVVQNLTQCGGDLVILNSSAGPAVAAEKTPIHQLEKPNVRT